MECGESRDSPWPKRVAHVRSFDFDEIKGEIKGDYEFLVKEKVPLMKIDVAKATKVQNPLYIDFPRHVSRHAVADWAARINKTFGTQAWITPFGRAVFLDDIDVTSQKAASIVADAVANDAYSKRLPK